MWQKKKTSKPTVNSTGITQKAEILHMPLGAKKGPSESRKAKALAFNTILHQAKAL